MKDTRTSCPEIRVGGTSRLLLWLQRMAECEDFDIESVHRELAVPDYYLNSTKAKKQKQHFTTSNNQKKHWEEVTSFRNWSIPVSAS